MNTVEIMRILEDWNFWKSPWEEGFPRPFYLEKMVKQVGSGQVMVITGSRRSGKSFLMRQLASILVRDGAKKEDILFVNFEDPRWLRRDVALLDEVFSTYRDLQKPTHRPYVFLDEVQEVEGWERWVRTMHELGKATIIISGSNAKLLSRELGTVLTGRHVDTVVYPLSFREFLSFRGISDVASESAVSLGGYFREYLSKGSFPALAGLTGGSREWFLAFYDDVLEKDLVGRFRIRKPEALKSLLNYAMSNISKPMTANAASKFLNIAPDTADKFLGYFEQAYLLFALKRFSSGVKEQQKSPRKIYAIDTALAGAIGFRMSEDFGRMAENIVYIEYLRRQVVDPEIELYYWKDVQAGVSGKEVDFVVKRGTRISEVVQVCMGDFAGETKKREMRALAQAAKKLRPERLLVITEEYEEVVRYEYGEVSFVPLHTWLIS
ncbi:MAG: ATP-binding protein [Candidatus Moraniibacteriota bacterium]